MFLKVKKSQSLKGEIKNMPPSKTHSFRALVLGSLAKGTSIIREPKLSNDWHEAIKTMQMYGAKIKEIEPNIFQVKGVGGKLKTPDDVINVGNSGTMLVFAVGVAAACPGWSVITGDETLRFRRTITKNLFKPFKELGVKIISTKSDGMAPFIIKGQVNGGVAHMDGTGCQPVFSVLIASAISPKPVEIFVDNPGEKTYIELLLYWFKKVGLRFENDKYKHYKFPGKQIPKSFDAKIPQEWSAPGYPLLAVIISPNSEIKIKGMDLSDPYGDKEVIYILKKMGADLKIQQNCLTAKSSTLKGREIDCNNFPDQVPTLALAGCFAKGKTVIKNAEIARAKECDRIAATYQGLKAMGAKIKQKKDGLIIHGPCQLKGAKIDGRKDHRMVLTFAIAGLQAKGKTIISDAEMLKKSFESFIPEMKKAGARLTLIK